MTEILDIVLAEYPLPFWALLLLGAGWLLAVFIWIRQKLSGQSKFSRYRNDTIFGLKWRWGYQSRRPVNLKPYCPDDDTELVYHFDDTCREVGYQCETCNRNFGPFSGDHSYVCGMITRQIEYRLRTGEWQNERAADVLIGPKARVVSNEDADEAEQANMTATQGDKLPDSRAPDNAPIQPSINLSNLDIGSAGDARRSS